jgi:Melibiase
MLGHARAAAALFFLCPFAAAGRAETATLRTGDTAVGLRAGPSGPAVVFLRPTAAPAWRNRESEPLVDFAFAEGVRVPLRWRWNRRESRVGPRSVSFVYDSTSPRLRLRWIWTARAASGPLEHTISIENLSGRELLLGLQESLRFAWEFPAGAGAERLSIEKGGGAPGTSGTLLEPVSEGARWEGHSSTYAREAASRPREIIPFLLVQSSEAPHAGFYLGAEFSGRMRLSLERSGGLLRGSAGLDPEPRTGLVRLAAGERLGTPTVFLGAARGGLEATGNTLRRWIRGTLARSAAKQDRRYPHLVLNSWGSGMSIDEPLARRMLKDAADLGFEMFHVDAGWFRSVGTGGRIRENFPGDSRRLPRRPTAPG